MKRFYKDAWGGAGSDGYLYDFAKRSAAKNYMGSFGSDGYLYDFAKVDIFYLENVLLTCFVAS